MRILHLVETLERGGLERVVISLALSQRAAGHEVSVCCLFHPGQLAAELVAAGMRVTSAGKSAGVDLGAVRHIRKALRESAVAVLHTHNAVANYYGALAAIGTDVRVFSTRHGMGFGGRPGRREFLYRASLLRTTAVAMVCEAARRHYVSTGVVPAALAHVVRNGIDTTRFADDAGVRRASMRRALGLAPDDFIVGTVGRLTGAKNHTLLIDAFAQLAVRRPSSRLLIVGDGALRANLEDRVAQLGLGDRVWLTGDRSDVPDLLAAMDVFALTSTMEGYSIALLEAAAAGLPAIASDAGGNGEIVQSGVTGRILSAPTPATFAAALMELADDPGARSRCGSRARAWIELHGSIGAMSRAYELLYLNSVPSAATVRVSP